jgi:hypothetical protein
MFNLIANIASRSLNAPANIDSDAQSKADDNANLSSAESDREQMQIEGDVSNTKALSLLENSLKLLRSSDETENEVKAIDKLKNSR